jgi:hypothetical protein
VSVGGGKGGRGEGRRGEGGRGGGRDEHEKEKVQEGTSFFFYFNLLDVSHVVLLIRSDVCTCMVEMSCGFDVVE